MDLLLVPQEQVQTESSIGHLETSQVRIGFSFTNDNDLHSSSSPSDNATEVAINEYKF